MVDATTNTQIRLLVNNDLSKYDEIRCHWTRIAKSAAAPAVSSNTTFAGDVGDYDDEADTWPEDPLRPG